jgi:hypothetical protein
MEHRRRLLLCLGSWLGKERGAGVVLVGLLFLHYNGCFMNLVMVVNSCEWVGYGTVWYGMVEWVMIRYTRFVGGVNYV